MPFLINFPRGGLEDATRNTTHTHKKSNRNNKRHHFSLARAPPFFGGNYLMHFLRTSICRLGDVRSRQNISQASAYQRLHTVRRRFPSVWFLKRFACKLIIAILFSELNRGSKVAGVAHATCACGFLAVSSFLSLFSSSLPSGTILTAVYVLQTKNGSESPRLSHRSVVALPL